MAGLQQDPRSYAYLLLMERTPSLSGRSASRRHGPVAEAQTKNTASRALGRKTSHEPIRHLETEAPRFGDPRFSDRSPALKAHGSKMGANGPIRPLGAPIGLPRRNRVPDGSVRTRSAGRFRPFCIERMPFSGGTRARRHSPWQAVARSHLRRGLIFLRFALDTASTRRYRRPLRNRRYAGRQQGKGND